MRKLHRQLGSAIILITVSVLLSCSSTRTVKKFESLSNQGILPLSTTNAYVGANLFIAEESRKSGYLRNFLKARGAPTAIEITEDTWNPPHMVMFYPKDREVYAAEFLEEKVASAQYIREWVIRGPYQIERKDFRELQRLEGSFAGEPLFVINGKEQRFRPGPTRNPDDDVREILVPVIPTPRPTKRPVQREVIKGPETPKVVVEHSGENPQDFKPLNLDQQAIQMSKGYAERAENGDVIHIVQSSSESLANISKWYTGSPGNIAAIAEANHTPAEGALLEGQRVVVPLKLLKTGKTMPLGFK